ncbi:dihydrodipicolinate synthetase [Truncatella angustata]|uniref:Dihydrodipicolinate synthetase n=1 Tax=Truncatella angustata TaxID=152316 RepID=A0A9P9A063_9PEZI|nr:dihydrodipicolinate synthetase [Truncatella angustata]KAH6658007.1 dihydrodipicolinate synthetase [Truncatella angustata]
MSTVSSPPTGVYVPVPTFFQEAAGELQAKVDVKTQTEHGIFLAKNGIRGLVLLGSTGEAIHLTRNERKDLVAGVKKGLEEAGYKDYPIMAGVLTNGVDETLEWLHDYKAAGAQWGLVLVPGYFGVAADQQNIKEWFTLIADNSPIPILIYNYPGVTNQVLVAPETYTALAQHPNIVGCKMSHGNVSHHVQVALDPEIDHAKFRVYSGFGQQLGPIVHFGAAGVIDGMAAWYPKIVVRLMDLAEKRPVDQAALDEAQKLQFVVSRAQEFIGKFGVKGIKEAVYRVTGFGNPDAARLPLKGRIPEGEWEKWHPVLLAPVEKAEATL